MLISYNGNSTCSSCSVAPERMIRGMISYFSNLEGQSSICLPEPTSNFIHRLTTKPSLVLWFPDEPLVMGLRRGNRSPCNYARQLAATFKLRFAPQVRASPRCLSLALQRRYFDLSSVMKVRQASVSADLTYLSVVTFQRV